MFTYFFLVFIVNRIITIDSQIEQYVELKNVLTKQLVGNNNNNNNTACIISDQYPLANDFVP